MTTLRLTGGRARGRVLRTPVPEGVRPTASRVREALFSVVGQDLGGCRVLDAFGGAGLVALEAWSRGADVVVVERDPRVVASLRRRIEEVGAEIAVIVGDVVRAAPRLGTFDGVFADPPYATDPTPALAALGPLATSWLVLEAPSGAPVPDALGALEREPARHYGGTALHVYR